MIPTYKWNHYALIVLHEEGVYLLQPFAGQFLGQLRWINRVNERQVKVLSVTIA
jgi:hypothetical protein